MKNISRSRSLIAALFIGAATPASAFMGVGDVVTDPILTGKLIASEAVRYGQTMTMISNQISAYQNMIYNTLTLQNPTLKPFGDIARAAANTYYQGQNLMYRAQNLDQTFGTMYPSYMNYQNYMMNVGRGGQTLEAKYKDWSDKGYDNVKSALAAANIQAGNMTKDTEMVEKLVQQASSTGGQMQALQGLNQLMGNQSRQMSGLNELLLTQVRMQANYYGQEIERRSAYDASLDNFKRPRGLSTGMGF